MCHHRNLGFRLGGMFESEGSTHQREDITGKKIGHYRKGPSGNHGVKHNWWPCCESHVMGVRKVVCGMVDGGGRRKDGYVVVAGVREVLAGVKYGTIRVLTLKFHDLP